MSRTQQRLMWFPFELQNTHGFAHKVSLALHVLDVLHRAGLRPSFYAMWQAVMVWYWQHARTHTHSQHHMVLMRLCSWQLFHKRKTTSSRDARINKQMHSIDGARAVTWLLAIMGQKQLRREPMICCQLSPSYQSQRYHQVYVGHWP